MRCSEYFSHSLVSAPNCRLLSSFADDSLYLREGGSGLKSVKFEKSLKKIQTQRDHTYSKHLPAFRGCFPEAAQIYFDLIPGELL